MYYLVDGALYGMDRNEEGKFPKLSLMLLDDGSHVVQTVGGGLADMDRKYDVVSLAECRAKASTNPKMFYVNPMTGSAKDDKKTK